MSVLNRDSDNECLGFHCKREKSPGETMYCDVCRDNVIGYFIGDMYRVKRRGALRIFRSALLLVLLVVTPLVIYDRLQNGSTPAAEWYLTMLLTITIVYFSFYFNPPK